MTGLDVAPIHEFARSTAIEEESRYPVEMIDRLPVFNVPLSSLESGFFLRGTGTDLAHVRLLADAASASELPPILVQKSNSRIVDGMHRLEAAKLRGEKSIRARFINCTDQEAFILAVKSNTLHGLPLSRADRISGAGRILSWHPDWSDRAVGAATGLSAKTIAGLRCRSADEVQHLGKRLGRDGKRHPVTGAEGRRRAAEYILLRPDASVREVAREADVSLGTVHDVRARLRRGADPTTTGQSKSAAEQGSGDPEKSVNWTPSAPVSLRSRRLDARPAAWPEISAKLASDPRLRYSESGRIFFRWMASHAAHAAEWREHIDAVPAHWLGEISLIADQVSAEWRAFAESLRNRQDPVS
jgi:transposase-like protein